MIQDSPNLTIQYQCYVMNFVDHHTKALNIIIPIAPEDLFRRPFTPWGGFQRMSPSVTLLLLHSLLRRFYIGTNWVIIWIQVTLTSTVSYVIIMMPLISCLRLNRHLQEKLVHGYMPVWNQATFSLRVCTLILRGHLLSITSSLKLDNPKLFTITTPILRPETHGMTSWVATVLTNLLHNLNILTRT